MVQYSQTFFNETIRQWTNQYIESGKKLVNAQKLALKRYTRIYGETTYPVPPLSIETQRMINLKRNPRFDIKKFNEHMKKVLALKGIGVKTMSKQKERHCKRCSSAMGHMLDDVTYPEIGDICDICLAKEFGKGRMKYERRYKSDHQKHKNPRKSKLSISEIEKNIDETENEYRFRLNNPNKYDEGSFRYKKIKRGISLVIACEKGSFFHNKCIGSTESQSIRFSKEEFGYNINGKKKVVAWLQKHLRKFK